MQKDKNLVQIVLANAGTVATFRSANPKDEELLLPQFRPYIEPGEITNLPSFHFYMKKSAIKAEEPFSAETLLTPITHDADKFKRFVHASRTNYASLYTSQQNLQKKIEITITEPIKADGKKPATQAKSTKSGSLLRLEQ